MGSFGAIFIACETAWRVGEGTGFCWNLLLLRATLANFL